MAGWEIESRAFDAVVGLDADAEWLLDENAGQRLFQRRPGGGTQDAAILGAPGDDGRGEAADDTPFAFLLSPDGKNGTALLAALDAVAGRLRRGDETFRLNVSEADRDRLLDNETAGALCDRTFFDAAADSGDEGFAGMAKAMRLSSALRPEAAPGLRDRFAPPDRFARSMRDAFGDAYAPSVVLGVIDDDFAVAHPRLRLGRVQGETFERSRLASYWDQEADFDATGSTVPFGRELTKGDFGGATGLDELLRAQGDGPLPEFYAQPGLAPFYPMRRNHLPRNASHGTHVLDLLGGAAPGTADDRPVVAVKLPRASVLDTSGAHLEFFLLQAVHHIVERAKMIVGGAAWETAKPKVVIVASYGFFGGPLDGASQFERALDAVIAAHGGRVQIVLPSGNGRLARAHAVMAAPKASDPSALRWRVSAGDRTPSVMEIWSEPVAGDDAQAALEIVTPAGLASPALDDVDVTRKLVLTDAAGRIVAEAVCARPALHPGRRVFLVWLGPTADPPPDVGPVGLAPAGVWTVRLRRVGAAAGQARGVWIRRDDSLPGYPRLGLQSAIERGVPHEEHPPLDAAAAERNPPGDPAARQGTISKIATGRLTVTVGGFSLADLRAATGSAGGPTADPPGWRRGPDAMAPSQVSPLRGVKAANFFGGAEVGYRGTSAAAPQLSRALADALVAARAVGPAFGWVTARDLAEKFETSLLHGPYAKCRPPEPRGGAGRFVDLKALETVFARDDPPWD